MAGIKQPIIDIMAKLQTVTVVNGDGHPVPLRARIWNSQVRHEGEGKYIDYPKPAAFLEVINGVSWQNLQGGYSTADIGWRIHIITEQFDAGDGTFDQNLTVFDLRDQVIGILSLYEPTGCGPLEKRSEEQDYDHTNLYHYIIEFVCNFIDSKGSKWDQGKLQDYGPPLQVELDVITPAPQTQIYNIP